MNRRSFLKTTAFSVAGASLPWYGCSRTSSSEPLFKISLAQWSLHRRLKNQNGEEPLDNLDFAKTARSFGIEGLEYVNQFFYDKARDQAYLKEMIARADGEGSTSLIIMVDREGQIGDPDEAKRAETVENHVKWLEAAVTLGCHSIRVNAASKGTFEEQQKLAADGLRKLCEKGDEMGINVIVENHGGLSSNGKWLTGVMDLVDHPRCGTLPDFGNFLIDRNKIEWYDIYQGVEELMPYAKAVSAKSYDWGVSSDPNVTIDTRPDRKSEIDFKRVMQIVLDHDYHGYVGIEYEGSKHSEMEGIALTKAALERVREELSS
ncbi:MAG: sugar phosphate isomerase/epimerase [Verrucomicrobia bacterium]|nr:sugar phosphate isomerase/epimerase [Verrucomicrobiota bacterium]